MWSEPPIRVSLLDELPELAERLTPKQKRVFHRRGIAQVEALAPGDWEPRTATPPEPGALGLLVLEGMLTREVVLGPRVATELVGPGDILRPADHDGLAAPVPFDVVWCVLEPTRVAVLDRAFARALTHAPEVAEVLMHGAVRRAQALAIVLAISHVRSLELRLLVLMWYLADRYGRVTPDGVRLSLRLTHETLGRLVGGQRPSTTSALKRLALDDRLVRQPDGSWMLRGDPPDALERLRAVRPSGRLRS